MSKNTNLSFLTDYITADITNGRIGINNASPAYAFDVTGIARTSTSTYLATASGNVGIGTTSPTDFIDATSGVAIIAPSGRSGLSLGSTQGTADEILARLSFTNTNSTNAGGKRLSYISGIRGTTNNSAYLEFGTANDGLGTQRMVISQTGNVGIGTATPSSLASTTNLIVRGTSAGATALIQSLSLDGGCSIGLYSGASASDDGAILYQKNLRFGSVTDVGLGGFAERMRITSGGNVGIGTSTPDKKLSVNNGTNNINTAQFYNFTGDQTATTLIVRSAREQSGNLYSHIECFQNVSTLAFRVLANGAVENATGSYGAISDIKLKENIIDATPKLEDLLKVKVCNYNFKGNKTKQIGVIAQELEKIFPSMVEESEDRDDNGVFLGTTTKSVKYSIFVPMLIKAVQELKAEIETLKNK